MRILFDHNVPAPLGRFLEGHTVTTAKEQGWDRLVNGDLLNAAELGGFEVLITGDKGIRYQQNIAGRRIALVVLGNTSWPVVKPYVDKINAAVDAGKMGSYVEVEIPFR